ncbi:kinase [Actinomycetota bacterium]|nr:kinase [Actinomycetota bacterium]
MGPVTHEPGRTGVGPTPVLVAVDGGGTKTDVVVLRTDGTVLARTRAGGSCPQIIGVDPAVAVVDGLVRDALDRALATDGHPLVVARAGVYLSGLDLPAEITTFRAAIAPLPWVREAHDVAVDNDTFALLRAGTDAHEAVAVVCGTGINCVGRRADGATARFPALGSISGDWGGGSQLGEQALWYAARAVDGRGEHTMLVELVPRSLGRATLAEVIEDLHFGRLGHDALPALAPVLLDAATAGDDVACRVVDRQADEIALLATTALRRLDLLEGPVPVVLGGGVISSRHPRLVGRISAQLADAAPHARLVFLERAPVLGAALLVLEAQGAGGAALDRAVRTFWEH